MSTSSRAEIGPHFIANDYAHTIIIVIIVKVGKEFFDGSYKPKLFFGFHKPQKQTTKKLKMHSDIIENAWGRAGTNNFQRYLH